MKHLLERTQLEIGTRQQNTFTSRWFGRQQWTVPTLRFQKQVVCACDKCQCEKVAQTPPQGRKIRLKLKTWCNLTIKVGSVPRNSTNGTSRGWIHFSQRYFFLLPPNKPPQPCVCVCVWISEAVCDLFCVGYPPMATIRQTVSKSRCSDFSASNYNKKKCIKMCKFSQIKVPFTV